MTFKQIMLQIMYCFILAILAYLAYSLAIEYFERQMALEENSLLWRYFLGK